VGGKALSWVTVYDVSKDGWAPQWPSVMVFLGAALLGGLVMAWWPRPTVVKMQRVFGGLLFAFGLLAALLILTIDVWFHWTLSNDLRTGRAQVVEGVVTNFDPGRVSCHDAESFDVSQVHFAYSDYGITGGFNSTSTCGDGPFRSGQRVRLAYFARGDTNVILRADIWQ
jgi:hypothetical protein